MALSGYSVGATRRDVQPRNNVAGAGSGTSSPGVAGRQVKVLGQRPVTGQKPAPQALPFQPVPRPGTPNQAMLQGPSLRPLPALSPYTGSAVSLTAPQGPSLATLMPSTPPQTGATNYLPASSQPQSPVAAPAVTPRPVRPTPQTVNDREAYNSYGSGNVFGGMQGSYANTTSSGQPSRTSGAGFLPLAGSPASYGGNVPGAPAGGAYGSPYGASTGGGNTASFDAANAATAQNRDRILQTLFGGGGPAGRSVDSALGRGEASMYANPTGMDAGVMQGQRRQIEEGVAANSGMLQKDLANRMAASGFSDSPQAAMASSVLRAQTARDLGGRKDALALADQQMRQQNRQSAADRMLQLLGLQQTGVSDAANQMGAFQFPFLTPDEMGGSGGGGSNGLYAQGSQASGGGGSSGFMQPNQLVMPRGGQLPVQSNNGLLAGEMIYTGGGLGSQEQLETLQGNALYRSRTGQDVPRMWDGRRFYGYNF